jgi:cyclopropane fatty-acyl-phospholipid synthase-like methyltransferase
MTVGFLILFLLVGSFAWGAVSAAPWVPLRKRDISRLLSIAELKPGELIYDLGCGDARVIVAAAQAYSVRAVGFEIALLPYCLAKLRVWFSGTGNLVKVRYQSFWSIPLGEAEVVFSYLTPAVMGRLETKLDKQLKPGAKFISYAFKLPRRAPTQRSQPTNNDLPIYLYT